MLIEHFKIACEPYTFERKNALTGEIEIKTKLLDQIDPEKSLLNLV
jgi:hypothetical protein